MITLTRKMFTMVLSVVVYDHRLTLGQWAGAGIVFGGISVEAWVKRKGQSLVAADVLCLITFFRGPRKACSTGERKGKDQVTIDHTQLTTGSYWTPTELIPFIMTGYEILLKRVYNSGRLNRIELEETDKAPRKHGHRSVAIASSPSPSTNALLRSSSLIDC